MNETTAVIEGLIRPVAVAEKAGSSRSQLSSRPAITLSKANFTTLASSVPQTNNTIPSQLRITIQRTRSADEENADQSNERESLHREMIAVPSRDANLKREVVQMDRPFMDAAGFHLGDRVRIEVNRLPEEDARMVVLQRLSTPPEDGEAAANQELDDGERQFVIDAAGVFVRRLKFLYPGASFTFNLPFLQLKPRYKVVSVNGSTHNIARITQSTIVDVKDGDEEEREAELVLQNIAGFDLQVEQINKFFHLLKHGSLSHGSIYSCGIVINGGSGAGKSFMLDTMARTRWGTVYQVNGTFSFAKIQETLKTAKKTRPSIIIIDDLDRILQKYQKEMEPLLIEMLDELARELKPKDHHRPTLIVAASCADYFTLPEKLREKTRFCNAVTLPVPNAQQRLEILKSILPSSLSDAVLREVAERGYGFTPRDLGNLAGKAGQKHELRMLEAGVRDFDPAVYPIGKEDFDCAFEVVKPSGLQDINLRPPTVRWDDIGGQEDVKKKLRAMVESIKNPSPTKVSRGKAALLYGPPGCAKTLFAQAIATEAGCNFFSVKGPELLSKYVGETERSLRALFARARAYSPSIIFFDEIDTMGLNSSKGGAAATSLLGAFLAEMDGFEQRGNVIVIAATNRPWDMDPSLQRAGRFRPMLYLGLPDESSRAAIVRVVAAKLSVDEAGLDYDEVARETEGYSGADLGYILSTAYETNGVLNMQNIREAIADEEPSVDKEMRERFEKWTATKKKRLD